jgi:hypothetical protein
MTTIQISIRIELTLSNPIQSSQTSRVRGAKPEVSWNYRNWKWRLIELMMFIQIDFNAEQFANANWPAFEILDPDSKPTTDRL